MAREKGVVKWFSTDKGYGFIRRESGDEIFVHHTDIEVDGYASLKNGETVEFDVFESDRGPKARNLVPLDMGATHSTTGETATEGSKPARSKAGTGGPKGRGRNASRATRDRRPRNDSAQGAADAKKPLAVQLRERLSKRFPGLGG